MNVVDASAERRGDLVPRQHVEPLAGDRSSSQPSTMKPRSE